MTSSKTNSLIALLTALIFSAGLLFLAAPTTHAGNITTSSQDFGSVPVGTSASRGFTLQNTETFGYQYDIAGGGSNFNCVSGCSGFLPVGGTANFWVTFTPTAVITYSDIIGAYLTSDGTLLDSASLTGAGTLPPPVLSVNPSATPARDFGRLVVGSGYSDRTFTITNDGGAIASGYATAVGEFQCLGGCNYSLAAGESQIATFRYTPVDYNVDTRNATFVFDQGANVSRQITGEGISNGSNPEISLIRSNAYTDFGLTNRVHIIRIRNTGTGMFNYSVSPASSIKVLGGGPLLCDTNCSGNLDPGQETTIYVSLYALSGCHSGILVLTGSNLVVSPAYSEDLSIPVGPYCEGGGAGSGDVDCIGSWGAWSACSSSNQTRTYTVTTPQSGSGAYCPADNGNTQSQACVVTPVNNASCVSITGVPTDIGTNGSFTAVIRMLNDGTSTWTAGSDYKIGSQSPLDNLNWGVGRVWVPNDVAPGESVNFTRTFTASSTPGVYDFSWRALRESVEWFGPACTEPNINVVPATSEATIDVPDCLIPDGGSNCTETLTWDSVGPTAPSIRHNGLELSTNANGSRPATFAYGTHVYEFYDGLTSSVLASDLATADCEPGLIWDTNRCVTPVAPTAPEITDPTSVSITSTSARLGANITSNGGSPITARGICWSISAGPDKADNCSSGGTALGVFTQNRTGLPPGTVIFYRGYADNAVDTGWTVADANFTTDAPTVPADLEAALPSRILTGATVDSVNGTYSNLGLKIPINNVGTQALPGGGLSDVSYMGTLSLQAIYGLPDMDTSVGTFGGTIAAGGTDSSLFRTLDNLPFGTHTFVSRVNLDGPNYPEDDFTNNESLPATIFLPVPDPNIVLNVPTKIIRVGQTVAIDWNVNVNYEMDCTVQGAGGVNQSFNTGTGLAPYTGIVTTTPLKNNAVFTLTCTESVVTGGIGGTTFMKTSEVEVVAGYEEL